MTNVIPLGARVHVNDAGIEGIVTGWMILLGGIIQYELTYWDESGRQQVWMYEQELSMDPVAGETSVPAGYHAALSDKAKE